MEELLNTPWLVWHLKRKSTDIYEVRQQLRTDPLFRQHLTNISELLDKKKPIEKDWDKIDPAIDYIRDKLKF